MPFASQGGGWKNMPMDCTGITDLDRCGSGVHASHDTWTSESMCVQSFSVCETLRFCKFLLDRNRGQSNVVALRTPSPNARYIPNFILGAFSRELLLYLSLD